MNVPSYPIWINSLKRFVKKDTFLGILALLAVTFYITFPLLIDEHILKMNDMSGNSVNLIYIKKILLEYGVFPQWNHLLNYGIPLVADPLNAFFNPLVAFSFLLFPLEIAFKLIYFFSIFLSGVTFSLLLRKLNISRAVALLISLTYMSSGFMTARIYAGHLEKIITYPLYPLLILSILQVLNKGGIRGIGITSLILSLFIWSGGIYEFLYAFITFGLMVTFYITKSIIIKDKIYLSHIKNSILVVVLLSLFSAFKILPLIEISHYFDHIREPFSGSQNALSFIYNMFLPNKDLFHFFQLEEYITLPYFWWEHYTYIGILPLICLLMLPIILKIKRYKEVDLFIFLFVALVSFSMLGSPFSPFHWLFKYISFLEQFRIPSRIFIVLVPVILILSSFILDYVYNSKSKYLKLAVVIFLFLNFIDVSRVFYDKLGVNEFIYSPPISDLGYLLNNLKKIDDDLYFIGQSEYFQMKIPVDVAIQNEQRADHNYGFILRKSYSSETKTISGIYPKYFIYPQGINPPDKFSYTEVITGNKGSKVYKNDTFTPFVSIHVGEAKEIKKVSYLNDKVKSITISPDKIEVVVDVEERGKTLLIMESYAPGWTALVDRKEVDLIINEYLNIPLEKGEHIYTFTYYNNKFILGLVITLISIVLWITYILKYESRNIKSKN